MAEDTKLVSYFRRYDTFRFRDFDTPAYFTCRFNFFYYCLSLIVVFWLENILWDKTVIHG